MRTSLSLLTLVLLLAACGTGKPRVVYLARHGQTEWNRISRAQGDPDLDAVGYLNRFSLWRLLKKQPLQAIYSSERQRTWRTAELLARQHHLKVQRRAALNEIGLGVFEGMCWSWLDPGRATEMSRRCEVPARGSSFESERVQAQRVFQAVKRKGWPSARPPLGESYADTFASTRTFVDELDRGLQDREILIVGHGVVNSALVHHFMGWPMSASPPLKQENDQVFRFEFGAHSVRMMLYTPGAGWKVCQASPPAPGVRKLDCYQSAPTPAPAPAPTSTPASVPANRPH